MEELVIPSGIENIENLKVEKQKELDRANDYWHTLEDGRLNLQADIIEIQGKKKAIEITLNKGAKTIKELKNHIAILNNAFWREKNGG